MNIQSFKDSLGNNEPPAGFSPYLNALWYDAKDNWIKAHGLVEHIEDQTASWIHAYLHRKEGDTWNADYWYRKAGKVRPATSLDTEWEAIVTILLNDLRAHS